MNEDGVDEFGSGTFLYSGAKSLYISPAMSSFNLRFDPVGMIEFTTIFFSISKASEHFKRRICFVLF